jgi:hypothetical protein
LEQDAEGRRRGVAIGDGSLGDGPVLIVIAVVALILDDRVEWVGSYGAKAVAGARSVGRACGEGKARENGCERNGTCGESSPGGGPGHGP